MNTLLDDVYKMYRSNNLGTSHRCNECKAWAYKEGKSLIGPIPIQHIGSEFAIDQYKILFLGAVAYGWGEEYKWSDVFNNTNTDLNKVQGDIEKRSQELFFYYKTRYYNVLRLICKKLYGDIEAGYNKIAISNFIKCNLDEVKDNFPAIMRSNCAHKLKELMVTRREIEIISPKIVISIAGQRYGNYLNEWDDNPKYLKLWNLPHPSRCKGTDEEYAERVFKSIQNIS